MSTSAPMACSSCYGTGYDVTGRACGCGCRPAAWNRPPSPEAAPVQVIQLNEGSSMPVDMAQAKRWITQLRERVDALLTIINAPVQGGQSAIPVWELFSDGWDGVDELDSDWLQTLPIGTRLYYLAATPSPAVDAPATPEMIEAGAEYLYGHTRAEAKEWAKEDKFDSCAYQAEMVWNAMKTATPQASTAQDQEAK